MPRSSQCGPLSAAIVLFAVCCAVMGPAHAARIHGITLSTHTDGGDWALSGVKDLFNAITGWDYTPEDIDSRQPAFRGYEKGVPMGGDLKAVKGKEAPTFMVYALRDAIGYYQHLGYMLKVLSNDGLLRELLQSQ